jgi:DNA-binding NarL/FixJ family response regulator
MNVLIIDRHPMSRDGLEILLRSLLPEAEISKASELNALPDEKLETANLLLFEAMGSNGDIDDGLTVVANLVQRYPELVVIVVTAYQKHNGAARAMNTGARGYIPKSLDREVMLNAVRLVLSGGSYAPPELYGSPSDDADTRPGLAEAASDYRIPILTRRQRDVLFQLSLGHSNREIASQLGIAEGTIKIHVAAIFKAMGVTNRTQAVIAANRLGLFPETGSPGATPQ